MMRQISKKRVNFVQENTRRKVIKQMPNGKYVVGEESRPPLFVHPLKPDLVNDKQMEGAKIYGIVCDILKVRSGELSPQVLAELQARLQLRK